MSDAAEREALRAALVETLRAMVAAVKDYPDDPAWTETLIAQMADGWMENLNLLVETALRTQANTIAAQLAPTQGGVQ